MNRSAPQFAFYIAVAFMFAASSEVVCAGDIAGVVAAAASRKSPAVVWIEGVERDQGVLKRPAVISQRSLQFEPAFVAVAQGQVVQFPNRDTVVHSVYSRSPIKQFDLGIFAEEDRRSIIADRVGMIPVRCALHADMYAEVLVVPTTMFTVVDSSGVFVFSDVPEGQHRIILWRSGEAVKKTILVNATGVTRVEF